MVLFAPVKHPLSLALQGGGAHGAFTWGVLDRLLETKHIHVEGISGTSAGAMNAVALAHGMMVGGRDGAREALNDFWEAVAASAPFKLSGLSTAGDMSVAPALNFMMSFTHYFSPYQLNPLDINPLRAIVEKSFDFERLRRHNPVQLFIAATNANTGHLRIFRNQDMSADALLASACLPMVHHSVEIEGEPYWDGGYSANPAIFPLYYHCNCADILMVLLAPMHHGDTPKTASAIKNRAMDIAFNAGFLREMRILAQARAFARESWRPFGRLEKALNRLRFHLIDPNGEMDQLPSTSRALPDQRVLHQLRDMGRHRAELWLQEHQGAIGKRSSVRLAELFL
ncbi:patatin-like phospholipase family protein [Candidatus Thalassolituus haligoni]|jgi:NTE family protein|uniref:patatin-like phospholipase family protein n=1 Tax=Candidatus Thalassolituus haligoni TaxID=3100113 RepID=UPI003518561A|tara:strand:- start:12358 stop:13380 length:1023 start_codon:yes stop_codon:yes gene_type:complete